MVIVVGPGTASEEQILISARSGNTLTVAASGRNWHLGGSGTGVAHNNAEVVRHVLDADSIDDANRHVNTDADDDHSQYHNAARFVTAHDVTARHPTAVIADGAITGAKLASETWTGYTPTLSQGGAVAKTVVYAKYQRVGRTIHFAVDLNPTATGTAANDVTVTLPVTAAQSEVMVGGGLIYDGSIATIYNGNAYLSTTTTVAIWPSGDGSPAPLGSRGFTAALTTGDIIRISGTYEAAS